MPDTRGKVTLEELMRAKRNERPEPEFWARFDREFRAKQKLLIQSQLVNESRLKSPLFTRFYKVGALTATCGIAAVAVYVGFQAPVNDATTVAQNEKSTAVAAEATPNFAVATTPKTTNPAPQTNVGLKEFATLAQPVRPRVVVQTVVAESKAPTKSQLNVIETLASLESTIKANRASGPAPTPSYQFVSSNGLFESEPVDREEQGELDGVWNFESAFMLGKYADPLTGTFDSGLNNRPLHDIQQVSLSQIDEALTTQGRRRSTDRSLDALTVRF